MGTDPLQKRAANGLILKLADPQAPLELPTAFYDLPHFIEQAGEFMKAHHRSMPDIVRERFEEAVRHARKLLDDLSAEKLLN